METLTLNENPLVNAEAEAATLGSMLLDQEAIGVVASILKPTDFYRERDQWLCAAIFELDAANKQADTVAIYDILQRKNQTEGVNISYLSDLSFATPTHINAAHYAGIVKDRATRRAAVAAAAAMAKAAYNLEITTDQLLSEVDQAVGAIIEGSIQDDHTHTMKELAEAEANRIDAASQRLIAGLPATDDIDSGLAIERFFGGWERTRLYILAGRPGMGKSAVGYTLALRMAQRGFNGIAFGLEMSAQQVYRRLLSQTSKITVRNLKGGQVLDDEWLILMESSNQLQSLSLLINDAPSLTVRTLRSIARRQKRILERQGKTLDFILIDYLQLITSDGKHGTRNDEVAAISKALKQLARELDCVVIALSQLSRAVEGRADKRPTLADLRDSGAIEQDADVVDLLYREEYYEEDTDKRNMIEYIRAKSRDEATGSCHLYFRAEFTQVLDLEIQRTELEIP